MLRSSANRLRRVSLLSGSSPRLHYMHASWALQCSVSSDECDRGGNLSGASNALRSNSARTLSSAALGNTSFRAVAQPTAVFGLGDTSLRAVAQPTATLGQARGRSLVARREMSTGSNGGVNDDSTTFSTGGDASSSAPSFFEDTASRLVPSFGSSPITPEEEVEKAAAVAADTAVQISDALPWDPTWYNPADQAINLLNYIQDATGQPYAICIAGATVVVRLAVFPLFVKAQRNTSRMAHMKPEMDILKAKIDKMGPNVDHETQMKMSLQMSALFKKYDCNPIKALVVPFVQAPIFMSMFFGLRKMPDYFPAELSTGGVLWFPDLTLADPLHVMPVACSLMFIAMMEVGKEQMLAGNPQQGPILLNAFRGLGVLMAFITWNFSTAIFCYWTTNNAISLAQGFVFRNKGMRKKLGIWDPPPPVPGQQNKGIFESIQGAFQKSEEESTAEKIKLHNEAIDKQKEMKKAGRNRRRGRRGK